MKICHNNKANVKKITLLVGLPCSGKTHLANEMAKLGQYVILDDISHNKELFKLMFLSGKPDNTDDIIITDYSLCNPLTRKACESLLDRLFPDYEIYWIYFENNPEKCHNNAKRRTGESRKVDNLIDLLSKQYTIPSDKVALEIWQEQT